MKFKLACNYVNDRHTRFSVFDKEGANCGTIIILTTDVRYFIDVIWHGEIDWRGRWEQVEKTLP